MEVQDRCLAASHKIPVIFDLTFQRTTPSIEDMMRARESCGLLRGDTPAGAIADVVTLGTEVSSARPKVDSDEEGEEGAGEKEEIDQLRCHCKLLCSDV